MSKKNLSRGAIEGGRSGWNKYERRQSSKTLRAKNRDYNDKVKGLQDADEASVTPVRKPVGKDFRDKLSPVQRWVDKQVGKNWNEVFSEICKKYDTRNLASRHIIYDHILGDIYGTGFRNFSFLSKEMHRWYIDEDGVLQKGYQHRHRYSYDYAENKEWKARADSYHREKVTQQFGDKKILQHGHKYYWAVPVYKTSVTPATPFRAAITNKWVAEYKRGDRISVEDKKFIFKRGVDAIKSWLIK